MVRSVPPAVLPREGVTLPTKKEADAVVEVVVVVVMIFPERVAVSATRTAPPSRARTQRRATGAALPAGLGAFPGKVSKGSASGYIGP